jgi:hypothetical protein
MISRIISRMSAKPPPIYTSLPPWNVVDDPNDRHDDKQDQENQH